MSSTAAAAPRSRGEPVPAEAMVVEMAGILARLAELTDAALADTTEGDRATDATRVDALALAERIQGAAAATQAAVTVRFARSQVTTQQAQVMRDPRAVGRGIGDQIALACRVSPTEGSRRLGIARALHAELPATATLLRTGEISFYVAGLVVTETRHLDPDRRRVVDAEIARGLAGCAPRQAAVLARRHAYAADPQGYTQRGRTARADRRVTLRPAPDTMSLLTGLLPVEQGVACWAALRRHTDTLKSAGDPRSRDQIMADALVERLTGQATARDVPAEVAIVVPVAALTAPTAPTEIGPTEIGTAEVGPAESGPAEVGAAELLGHGPLPMPLAREILADSRGEKWWRRLFTAPHGGVVGGDSSRRCFDGTLATLIGYRDGQRCTAPSCDAPARQIDHIHAHRAGGPTSFTNGRAVCVRTNQVRETPGSSVRLVHDGLGAQPHTVATTTPTGHTYTSRAGPAP